VSTSRDVPANRHALALWRRGLSVFPLPRPRPGVPPGVPGDGKVPAMRWKELQKRLPTWNEIAQWFGHEPVNIAAATGAVSDVVVIDADAPEALRWCTQHLPYTPWQTHTARGFHLWYGHPGVSIRNRARLETRDGRLAIDVRGDGGYVVAPGSVHASGTVYEFAGDWTVPRGELPRFRLGWLQQPTRPRRAPLPTRRPSADLIQRARRYLAAVPRPEISHGSDRATLYAACRLVRGFMLSAAHAEALLWEWAGDRPGWTREWIVAKVAHAERYGTEPIGALR
jgi:hypothetical protein